MGCCWASVRTPTRARVARLVRRRRCSTFRILLPPTSLGTVALSSRSTSPTFEHRAFTYHEGRAFIPAGYDAELFAVRVSRAGLTVEEQIRGLGSVLRTLPLGAQLHLIENGWIETHDLETLERQGGLELTP